MSREKIEFLGGEILSMNTAKDTTPETKPEAKPWLGTDHKIEKETKTRADPEPVTLGLPQPVAPASRITNIRPKTKPAPNPRTTRKTQRAPAASKAKDSPRAPKMDAIPKELLMSMIEPKETPVILTPTEIPETAPMILTPTEIPEDTRVYEEWTDLPAHLNMPGYKICELGVTQKNNDDGTKLRILYKNADGYLKLTISLGDGKTKNFYFHRLLAMTFIPNDDPTKDTVDHKDCDKSNNLVRNLRWATRSEQNLNKKYSDVNNKPVVKFNAQGTILDHYPSMKAAAKANNMRNGANTISLACNPRQIKNCTATKEKTFWQTVDDWNHGVPTKMPPRTSKKIVQCDLEWNPTKYYKSVREVELDGFKEDTVGKICRGKRQSPEYGGYLWKADDSVVEEFVREKVNFYKVKIMPVVPAPVEGMEFVDIDGKYRVYANGCITDITKNNKIKKQHYLPCGMLYVDIGGVDKKVHLVVADAFIPNTKNLPFVLHDDGNYENNHKDNLIRSANNNTIRKIVHKLDKDGEIVETYDTYVAAAKANGMSDVEIKLACTKNRLTKKEGFILKSEYEKLP
jgi:hypothetical protein